MRVTVAGYFQLHAEGNIVGARTAARNIEDIEFFVFYAGQIDFAREDIHKVAAELCGAEVGLGQARTELVLGFAHRLRTTMPDLCKHLRATGTASIAMVCAIERALQDLPEDYKPQPIFGGVQEVVIRKLTATRARQHLPSPKAVANAIREYLEDAYIGRPKEEPPRPQYAQYHGIIKDMCVIEGVVDPATAEVIDINIENVANANKISKVDAFTKLLIGEVTTNKVTIFGFEAPPKGDATPDVSHLLRSGALTKEAKESLRKYSYNYRNVFEVAAKCGASYLPTPQLRALVQARDGHCRFPNCNVPATWCDEDHVVNYFAGGWTTVSNLHCLCRLHHNMKTDRKLAAFMTTSGICTWFDTSHPSGELINLGTTMPEGALAGIAGPVPPPFAHGNTRPTNVGPPIREGLGRFGITLENKNRKIREKRKQRRKPLKVDDEEPPF